MTAPTPEDVTPAVLERRHRLQSLAGLTVHSSDGTSVGRVRDIYQRDATGELAAITVQSGQLSSRTVLVPAVAISSLPPAPAQADDQTDARAEPVPTRADGARAESGPSAGTDAQAEPPEQGAHHVELRVVARTLKAALAPPATGHASPELLREAAAALGLAEQHPADGPPDPAPTPGEAGPWGEA